MPLVGQPKSRTAWLHQSTVPRSPHGRVSAPCKVTVLSAFSEWCYYRPLSQESVFSCESSIKLPLPVHPGLVYNDALPSRRDSALKLSCARLLPASHRRVQAHLKVQYAPIARIIWSHRPTKFRTGPQKPKGQPNGFPKGPYDRCRDVWKASDNTT